jgi:hypothetical protein
VRAAYRIRSGVEGVIRSNIVQGKDSGDLGEISSSGVFCEYWPTGCFLDLAGYISKGHPREIPGERNASGNVGEDQWLCVWQDILLGVWLWLRRRVGRHVDGQASALHTHHVSSAWARSSAAPPFGLCHGHAGTHPKRGGGRTSRMGSGLDH